MLAFLAPVAAPVRGFFAWWGGELLGLVPETLRKRLDPGLRCLALHPHGGGYRLRVWEGGKSRQVVDTADGRALQAAVARHGRRAGRLVLCLPRAQALFKELALPALPQPELRRALYYQIDRQTPFAARDVCFDYDLLASSRGGLRALLAVVPKRVVEHETQRLAGFGLQAAAVAVGDPDDGQAPQMRLRSGCSDEVPARSFASILNPLLATAACVLIAAAGHLAFQDREAAAAALAGQVREARQAADAVAKLEEEVALLRKDLTFFTDRKRTQPLAVAILLELTRILPDHTWLTELQYRDREIRIAGHSAAASDLVALIDGSEMFAEPRFRSPVTQDPTSGRERFNLTFRIAGATQ